MHELAICQEILSQVSGIAANRGARQVDRIVLEIGPLSGVEIPLLKRAFSVARASTIAASAELRCESCDIRIHCRGCGKNSVATAHKLTCRHCGDWQIDVLQGEEMLLRTVELSGFSQNGAALQPVADNNNREPCRV